MSEPIPVTVDNFVRAETDLRLALDARKGGFGKFAHHRQPVTRDGRRGLHSSAVFDLDAGPVTIVLPEAEGRDLSLRVFDEDHYVREVAQGAGWHSYAHEPGGTRYLLARLSVSVDPDDVEDLARARALQGAIQVLQASPGRLETPNWDPVSQGAVREALRGLAATVPDQERSFGPKGQVDPVRHLIGVAAGWSDAARAGRTWREIPGERWRFP
jgi:hypothetical protein